MKKVLIISFLFCFVLFNFVVANGADDLVEITIPGCSNDQYLIPADECSYDGAFYCSENGELWDVLNVPDACYGLDGGSRVCCPNGYNCVLDGYYLCQLMDTDCSDYTSENDCTGNNNNCYWDGSSCVYPPRTCGDYTRADDCNNQTLTARAAQGECIAEPWVDSDGQFYVVPVESCRCSWVTDKCELSYNITSTIGDDSYSCSKQYEYDNCTNGVQPFEVIASLIPPLAPPTDPNLAEAFDCVDDSGNRVCGVKLIQVSFFGWFNLVLVVALISMIYLVKVYKRGKRK